jgi:hypothetical protein
MSELVRRDYYDPAPVSRQTRKERERIEQAAIVRRAALEAAAKDALEQIEVRANERRAEGVLNVHNAYHIADVATSYSTAINHKITQNTRDNPGLELIQRGFEDTAALVARLAIYNSGTSR